MLPFGLSRELVPLIYIKPGLDLAPFFGYLGLYPVDVVADVHPISNGALVIVFHHEVLVKKAKGLL